MLLPALRGQQQAAERATGTSPRARAQTAREAKASPRARVQRARAGTPSRHRTPARGHRSECGAT
eukprot:8706285-Heterocapsa_arctica.AAC.1